MMSDHLFYSCEIKDDKIINLSTIFKEKVQPTLDLSNEEDEVVFEED